MVMVVTHTHQGLVLLTKQRDCIEPSMLQLLRETHRRPDGTYVDRRAQSIDEEMNRHVRTSFELESETQALDGTGATGLTQVQEDELYFKVVTPTAGRRVYGLGGQQPICECGESSSMGASRLTLQRQVAVLQEQLANVFECMKKFVAQSGESNSPSTPWTMPSGPTQVHASELERALDAAARVVNGSRILFVPIELQDNEQNDGEEEDYEGNDEFAAY